MNEKSFLKRTHGGTNIKCAQQNTNKVENKNYKHPGREM